MDPAEDEELVPIERWWRDHYVWLKEQGYVLRSRYAPDWVPSWSGKKGRVYKRDYEDGQAHINAKIIDATGPDGKRVCLKRIELKDNPEETSVMQQLNSPPLSQDAANHCIPLLKTLEVPDAPEFLIVVIPLLRSWTSPPIGTIGEGIEFIRQLIEGVRFLHQHGFAHRDIKYNNVMMDGSELYPQGFHFVDQSRTPDFKRQAPHLARTERPPKYYLIDFGHAKKYDISNGPPMDDPIGGGDYTVPEHQADSRDKPCDPFKVDVYCTGNVLRWYFTQGYIEGGYTVFHPKSGFDFLVPLVNKMVDTDPKNRPTIEEVAKEFDKLRASLSSFKLRSRLTERREFLILTVFRDMIHWGRTTKYIALGLPATPAA